MESNEPKRIARAMNAKGLMTQEAWPGLGHLRAKAKIVHEDAIEKFLDQRYLTFSAGSHTDRYVCSTCFTDWASEAPCEHVPGTVDQDGNLTVFITGTFYGDEASVLTSPANDLSSVISLQMTDGSNQKVHLEKSVTDLDPYTIFTTDGRFEIESEDDPLEIPMNMDELIDKLLPLLLEKLKDSLAVAKEVEVEKTVDTTSNQQEDAATEDASSDSNAESDVQVDSQTQTSVVDENSTSEDNVSVLTDSTSSVSLETLASAISEIQALLVTDRTAKQELDNQTKELQDLKNDYAQALQMVDSLKQEVQNLKQSVSVVDNKNSELENIDTAKSSFGSVEDPSESNAKTLIDTNTSDKKLDPFQARFVDRYKEINSIFGARKADAYIRQQKDRGFLPSNFKIQDFLKEND